MTDLRKLIEAVEAGNRAAALEHAGAVPTRQWQHLMDAMGGSLDAAKALHDALLPGCWADIRIRGDFMHAEIQDDNDFSYVVDNQKCPARAWLIAILRTKEAQEWEDDQ